MEFQAGKVSIKGATMRVKEIQVKGLFGTFDHTIPLTNNDRITIIHGPNGFGKTVMLKMIAALVENDIGYFMSIPFTEFRILLFDGSIGVIRRVFDDDDKRKLPKIEISLVDANGMSLRTNRDLKIAAIPKQFLDHIDNMVPSPYTRSRDGWINRTTGEFMSLNDIMEIFPNLKKNLPKKFRKNILPEITRDMAVFFIETKRLEAEIVPPSHLYPPRQMSLFDEEVDERPSSRQRYSSRVNQYSQDIVQRIKSALADYAKHSQESDRTFPERLVRFVRDNGHALPERDILDRMVELESKRQRLISLGFLDSESGLRDLTEEDVRRAHEALTIYVSDVQEKLAVFDDLSQRVGKLIDIVNERFKYKNISLHREQGFRVQTDSGNFIDLENLSSGEQHELVVLYELLFRAPKNGLVLVDEPEISLHVGWQSRFLSDLMAILELTGSYGIVATHSPVIIGTRWDLTQQLNGPDKVHKEAVE
jgi:predicted ATP-binding protein involved in virulence